MIRTLVWLWFAPIALLWSWYCLSYYDVAPASGLFSRSVHDGMLALYGSLLGIDPAAVPAMVARAFALDALLVVAIVAVRRRRAIADFVKAHLALRQPSFAENSAESLSSAP